MLNNIVVMGRLTRDVELKTTPSGVSVATLTLAVERDRKNENGEKDTDFIDAVLWRYTAEFAEKYFSKGKMAVVSGRLQTRKWTDKEGNKRTSYEIAADNIYFADSKSERSNNTNAESYTPTTTAPAVDDFTAVDVANDGLPF